ncbi:MAG: CehA/McbA family metallohydrolase [Armatimonadota bacterium]
MSKFTRIGLSRHFNTPGNLRQRGKGRRVRWRSNVSERSAHIPRGRQSFWGIPFVLGPDDLRKKGIIVIAEGQPEVEIPLGKQATHVCILHFCDTPERPQDNSGGGEHCAEYMLRYAQGDGPRRPRPRVQAIRRRFEINRTDVGWGDHAFASAEAHMPQVPPPDADIPWGRSQTGVVTGSPFSVWVYALPNPRWEDEIESITLRPGPGGPVAVLGITLYIGSGHPLRHVPRRVYKLVLPASERTTTDDLKAEIDMGVITRLYAVPGRVDESWVKAEDRGLGAAPKPEKPGREFLIEASGAEGASLTVKAGRAAKREISFGEAFTKGRARSEDKAARLDFLQPRTTWVYVEVEDGSTGKPTPTRAHFRGPHGEYLPPYGHHAVVNENWFEDYAGDLQLGGMSFAYVPGRFQIELPVGDVYVELSKGFEYQPLRKKLNIRPGQRALKLRVNRWADLRSQGWVTADTHVHFISPQTAWLEGQGEGLNLINLLASQWGRLFTNVGDITGELSGCSADDTLVWVGTENRHHLLGHISMLGTHGDPVFPMCTGGPGEAYIGDPDVTTLTEWAETCKEREGVVIRPHFPTPVCEEPVYIALGQLDGAELRRFADPASGSLDEFCFNEWYRYLNCGFRVAAVGGTDKMSAGMPVGGARTYAQLDPDEPFDFANWGKAVRAGRTFTSSGPIMTLSVDGHGMGDEMRMPAGGGSVEVHARAQCIWPLHRLEIVVNGQVVASTSSRRGPKTLKLERKIRIDGSSWVAARCGSEMQVHHCWPLHLGAHTSPVYIVCGGQEIFSPSDASYMLTLIDGGMTWLDTLSVRYDERRHRQLKAVFRRAQRELHRRMHEAGHPH